MWTGFFTSGSWNSPHCLHNCAHGACLGPGLTFTSRLEPTTLLRCVTIDGIYHGFLLPHAWPWLWPSSSSMPSSSSPHSCHWAPHISHAHFYHSALDLVSLCLPRPLSMSSQGGLLTCRDLLNCHILWPCCEIIHLLITFHHIYPSQKSLSENLGLLIFIP